MASRRDSRGLLPLHQFKTVCRDTVQPTSSKRRWTPESESPLSDMNRRSRTPMEAVSVFGSIVPQSLTFESLRHRITLVKNWWTIRSQEPGTSLRPVQSGRHA